jgi:hypothetical protein
LKDYRTTIRSWEPSQQYTGTYKGSHNIYTNNSHNTTTSCSDFATSGPHKPRHKRYHQGSGEAGKAAAVILQETNNIAKAIQSAPSPKSSYTSVLSSNLAPISRPITIYTDPITHSSTT